MGMGPPGLSASRHAAVKGGSAGAHADNPNAPLVVRNSVNHLGPARRDGQGAGAKELRGEGNSDRAKLVLR